MDNDIRIFGYCAYCNSKVTDDAEEYYCNDDGEVFCSVECVMEHYGVYKLEV